MEAFNNGLKPSYIFNGPFRFVKTHEHLFHTYAKGRWVGRAVIDVLEKEFHAYNREYYLDAISKGRILLNGAQFDNLKHFKNNDLLEHRAQRTEPPTLNILPKILFEDDTMVVVSKPPYLSIHANGGFHFNSLVGLLLFEMGYNNLHVLHRIDKLTSGVMMFGKSGDVSKKFHESTDTQKSYLARVHGEFKDDYLEYSKPIVCLSIKECTYDVLAAEGLTEEELKKKNAKESKTIIKKRWYDKDTDTSLLECQPITGRTHQIRVHLKSLGHPIVNDTLYGGKFVGNGLLRFKFPHLFESNTKDDKSPVESLEKSAKSELEELNILKEKDDLTTPQKSDKDLESIVKKLKTNEGEPVVVHKNEGPETAETSSVKEGTEKYESKPAEEKEEEIQITEDTKNPLFKLTKKGTVYTLSGGFIENHQWCYITQPMEICLHSVKYKFMSYTFEDEEPYWADKNYNFAKMAAPIAK